MSQRLVKETKRTKIPINGDLIMSKIVTIMAATALFSVVSSADAKGIVKGAAKGAAVGHFVGHGHAKAGAMVGAVHGHHHAKMKAKAG